MSFEEQKIGEYHSDIPKFELENIQTRDTFIPIARERKYMVDYIITCNCIS